MNRWPNLLAAVSLLAGLLFAGGFSPVTAQGNQSWPEVKCARYKKAWSDALARLGTRGIGSAFLERHAAFLASGCTARADVCPRSDEELRLANVLVILAMNAGTASTFPPFACRK